MSKAAQSPRAPNRAAALSQYRRRAAIYDQELALLEPVRRKAIAMLALKPGDVVLDVGCGTGLSLEHLRQGAGTKGRIIGIEQSPEMIAKARARAARNRWNNVTLICSPVESAKFAGKVDAALFHFTHDILRNRQAIANIVRHLKPGARIVACGLKWSGGWGLGVNLLVLPAALHSVTSLEGLHAPWDRLAVHIPSLQVEALLFGGVYLASGALH